MNELPFPAFLPTFCNVIFFQSDNMGNWRVKELTYRTLRIYSAQRA